MNNSSRAWITVSLLACIALVALLWRSWAQLGTVARYTGIAVVASLALVATFIIVRAVQVLHKHQLEIVATKIQNKITQEEHEKKWLVEMQRLQHEQSLQLQQFELQRHITMTRLAPTEHGYEALIERDPISGYSISQIPYAGRYLSSGHTAMNERITDPQTQAITRVYEMPTQDYILSQLKRNALEVAPGIDARTGELKFLSIPDAVHFKLIGSSGFGKSCLAASLIDQATRLNGPDRLQLALLDCEAKTSLLFQDVPHIVEAKQGTRRIPLVSSNADEVAAHLTLLVAMLHQRAKLTEYELQQQAIVLIYVEEMLSLQYEVDPKLLAQMLADLSVLALRARKYNMFLLACSQTDYSTKELQAAQKQFRSRIAFAVDTTAARAAGFMSNDLIKQNFSTAQKGDGHFVMEYPGFSGICIAPQYDVRAMLLERSTPSTEQVQQWDKPYIVDTTSTVSVPTVYTSEPSVALGSDKIEQVEHFQGLGWGKVAIIEKVWNVKKGGSIAYKNASAEYEQIVAELAERIEA